MKPALPILSCAALLLAGCQPPAEPRPAPTPSPSQSPEPSPASRDVAVTAPAAPTPAASPAPADATIFPPRFRGRWGLTLADCDPGRADNKGLMRIEARIVRFYESRGPATAIERETPGTLFATLAMTGEGQTWTDKTRFTLGDEGATLLRASDQGEPLLLYRKCD